MRKIRVNEFQAKEKRTLDIDGQAISFHFGVCSVEPGKADSIIHSLAINLGYTVIDVDAEEAVAKEKELKEAVDAELENRLEASLIIDKLSKDAELLKKVASSSIVKCAVCEILKEEKGCDKCEVAPKAEEVKAEEVKAEEVKDEEVKDEEVKDEEVKDEEVKADKKPAKKSGAKKSGAKKSGAKKSTAKKSTAKKSSKK